MMDKHQQSTNNNKILRAQTLVFSRGMTKSIASTLHNNIGSDNDSQHSSSLRQRKYYTLSPIYDNAMDKSLKKDNKNLRRYWCVLGYDNISTNSHLHFYHFPHAAEAILPCWSWFRRHETNNALKHCGIVLLGLPEPKLTSWMGQLLVAMNCTVRSIAVSRKKQEQDNNGATNDPDYVDPRAPFHDPNGIFYAVPKWWKMPRDLMPRYLLEPMDAWTLRQRVVSDDTIIRHKQQATASVARNYSSFLRTTTNDVSVLQIGLVQRISSSRVLMNLTDLEVALQDAFPTAIVSTTTLSNTSLRDQALWFATQDIIIGAHGASMTNCLFILPETIVYQIYPKYYFYQSLEPLIQQAGGYALSYSPNTPEMSPMLEFLSKRPFWRNLGRTVNITFDADVIVRHLKEFLEEQPDED